MTDRISLAAIKDGGAQMRVRMNTQTVQDYAEDMVAGVTFPPVVVFRDGADYWLADGFHRVAAARQIGRDEIDSEILEGDSRAAMLHAVGANAKHGLRRTQEDKQRAIEAILRDQEWSKWSDRKIAKAARVDHKTVGKVRRELLGGEIPTRQTAPPSPRQPEPRVSMVADFLRTVGDEDLIVECRRRRLDLSDV